MSQHHRLHLDPGLLESAGEGERLELPPEAASYLVRVLRLGVGDTVEIFDGLGFVREAALVAVEGKRVYLQPGERRAGLPLPPPFLLLQPVLKGEKMDWLIQKACELGLSALWPVSTERCVVQLDPKKAEKRLERWRKIAEEACRQCGRADLPELRPPSSLREALAALPPAADLQRLVAWEEEEGRGLREAVRAAGGAPGHALLVGPEGGLTAAEVEAAQEAGFEAVSLGGRILRAETAGLAVLAALRFEQGELGR
ncbi:MAG: 16S rRNA (uracil(1498)-N(3))-methyltransferase [Deltaproteobacteria bacterium]|nr:16S rRNA (uracil(1498)-N(3))-methyltransferase [Deltaproteobacteria bacterium]